MFKKSELYLKKQNYKIITLKKPEVYRISQNNIYLRKRNSKSEKYA